MDTDVLDAHLDSVTRSEACDVNHFDHAFTDAFLKTDEEFGKVRAGVHGLVAKALCQRHVVGNQ